MPVLTKDAKNLIDRPNFAHLATLMPDGSPQSVPVWVGREAEHIVVCTGENSLKAKNTRRDPRVALSISRLHRSLRGSPSPRPRDRAPTRPRSEDHGSHFA